MRKKTKDLFPERVKNHNMEKREDEKYYVQHAKTERLKNSAIPYMQRILNNQYNLETRNRKPG